MHEIRADVAQNRLYITIGKKDYDKEGEDVYNLVKSEAEKLKKGFSCLTDFTGFVIDAVNAKWLIMAQELLTTLEVSEVVQNSEKSWAKIYDETCIKTTYRKVNVDNIEDAVYLLKMRD